MGRPRPGRRGRGGPGPVHRPGRGLGQGEGAPPAFPTAGPAGRRRRLQSRRPANRSHLTYTAGGRRPDGTGGPVSILRNWENGRGFPGVPVFLRLAEALGVPAGRLAEGVDDPAEEPGPVRAPPHQRRKGRAR
jgi:hypothetical protein